jgi:uncharacterized protein (TIGR00299 family) protein
MRLLRFDSVGGASGDMILAALSGLSVDINTVSKKLSSIGIGKITLQINECNEHGLKGQHISIKASSSKPPVRTITAIKKLLETSDLSEQTVSTSLKIFQALAEAEGHVHGISPEKVHFHEIGAVDSIVDIVGACLMVELLNVDRVWVGPLPLGYGTVRCEHGVLPVPAPATLELLKNHPVVHVEEPFELVTPTAAAILTTLHQQVPEGSLWKIVQKPSCGFGNLKLYTRPDMLRATLFETVDSKSEQIEECLLLECNLDDMNPELIGALCQKLLASGALDVFTSAVQMKKQRPGVLLSVLCHYSEREKLLDTIFQESTTFGVREHSVRRTILSRYTIEVSTPYGNVRVKVGKWKNKEITFSPEYEDCASLAKKHNVSLKEVYTSVLQNLKLQST